MQQHHVVTVRGAGSAVAALALALLVGGCGSEPSAAAPTPASTGGAVSQSAPTTIPPTTPVHSGTSAPAPRSTTAATGCAPTGAGVPAGASSKPIIDVDGDGRADVGWINGGVNFGITTASGATFSIPMELAGGGPRSVLVVNPDEQGNIAALASDERTVELLLVRNCELLPAKNAEGTNYEFDLGLRGNGTGVGCSQVAGTPGRSLVGLNLHLDGAGQPVGIQRTQIVLNGTNARNGASDTVAPTPAAVQTGREITCDDLTLRRDGVLERP
ncbi:MAG: hypothetical protein ABI251_07815 [Mycobacteriaceae bacterium]